MLTSQWVDLLVWFYPVGNTPAVSLTRGQPPSGYSKTDILLLGCGDARHILFTCNVDGRPMDITCCDREKAVLARNIILFTLLLDDTQGARNTRHWKLYYHLYITDDDLSALRNHARRLCRLSSSLQDWHRGPYGRVIRFTDRRSLAQVRELWQQYALPRSGNSLSTFESHYHYWLQKSIGIRSTRGDCTGNLRSIYPGGIGHAKELKALKSEFWEDLPKRHKAYRNPDVDVRFNPMFAVAGSATQLHFRTDPLDGYHIALAYIATTGPTPLNKPRSHRALEAAKAEFCNWSFSFRKCVREGLVLRFFSGDALALCHTLQHVRQHPDERTANLYRDKFTFEPLILDGDDWGPDGTAPSTFNVIDTSNLLDHVEGPNLLPAVSPLLTSEPSACLYMELLDGRERALQKMTRGLFFGDLLTVGLLAGLAPCEYALNTSTVSAGHEALVDYQKQMGGLLDYVHQRHMPITWKRALTNGCMQAALLEPLRMSDDSIFRILMGMNREMFKHERSVPMLQKMSLAEIARDTAPTSLCHRGSLASFIGLIKSRLAVGVENAVNRLLVEMRRDLVVPLSDMYLEEFILHLHLRDVLTVDKLANSPLSQSMRSPSSDNILSWTGLPPVVSITMIVSRVSLLPFMQGNSTNTNIAIPFLECLVKSPEAGTNAFAALQTGFGTLCASGRRWTDDFQLQVSDDKAAWAGHCDLIVSFLVPSWILIAEPENTEVALCIKSCPDTMHFVAQLGSELAVFTAQINDSDHVFITKNMPNQNSQMKVGGFAACDVQTPPPTENVSEQTLEAWAHATPHNTAIVGLTRRLYLKSPEIMSRLLANVEVMTSYISPWTILVEVARCEPLVANFPLPLHRFGFKARMGPRGNYIDVADELSTGPTWLGAGGSPFPNMWNNYRHTLWNLTNLHLDRLPEIITSRPREMTWLRPHLAEHFSDPERKLSMDIQATGHPRPDCHPNQAVRYCLKRSIYEIIAQFANDDEWKPTAFAISFNGRAELIIFPAKLRLDLGSRAVVLDAIVLPVTAAIAEKHGNFLSLLLGYGVVKPDVGEGEMILWKETLPAWVERCRAWEHRADCEYVRANSIPLSTKSMEQPLCSCGNGLDLPEFPTPALPDWEEIMKLCVRAAISPMFPNPLVDNVYEHGVSEDAPWYASR
ncbi:unnamed protein product [Clonostachys chloroleuca]|uniref:DUF4470 domain-containing protein n=1 Tax=Clonostachys chloroleuca TaxID=1926264 RepID=A0AA35Q8G9_9HYPO|nr:unnamed protein product [Clonostachys chloroleuca]